MIARLAALSKRPFFRYALVGGSVYIFELAVIAVVQWRGGNALLAVALSFWLGLLASFGLQKLVTFADERMQHKILLMQAIAFLILVLFNFGFTILMTRLLSRLMPATLIRTLALAITTIWNYYLYRTRIFRTNKETLLVD